MTLATEQLIPHWAALKPILSIRSDREYDRAVKQLNLLLDQIGDNERHPLYGLLDTLGILMEAWESQQERMPKTTGLDVLSDLMAEHNLTQSDLSEIGSQGVVSEILNGKRELNVRQIRALSERFAVSPAAFV
jgi:HTH-type transcriptional regulator/antitoxin HigA